MSRTTSNNASTTRVTIWSSCGEHRGHERRLELHVAMFKVGDKVIVKLQKLDARTEHFDAPGVVVQILDDISKYLVGFTPPLRDERGHYTVQMECSAEVLEPA